jgi:hypothetical protein
MRGYATDREVGDSLENYVGSVRSPAYEMEPAKQGRAKPTATSKSYRREALLPATMSDDENGEMEDIATPSDFLEHIPSKAQRIEVRFQMEPCQTQWFLFSRHFIDRIVEAISVQQEAAESFS